MKSEMSANSFRKDYLDYCLNELAREFRKINGNKIPAEIVLVGGAAVLINYGFREKTYDIDAIIHASSTMKDAINIVGDKLELPNGWLNSDFQKTSSYSPKLPQYSTYYKCFRNILEVRTITKEYLIAMKLMLGRQYKNDLSDVIGILYEEEQRGNKISLEAIQKATCDLYGSWSKIPQESLAFIAQILYRDQTTERYMQYLDMEMKAKESLIDFEYRYPHSLNQNNITEILKLLAYRSICRLFLFDTKHIA